MKGDFSRDTFDPLKHFTRVLQQQGRVQLDADTNEQTAILLHYLRTLVTDLIGPFAGPKESFGFEIKRIIGDNENFSISKGRYYVDGILCENDDESTYKKQKDYLNPTPELDANGSYLVYLDVWERHISALEDDVIREKALGGLDTTTRTKVVWQVKIEKGNDILKLDNHESVKDEWTTKWVSFWQPIMRRGLLKAQIKPSEGSKDPCAIAPDAKYRGQENQLYRIEIHNGGVAGGGSGATFKWSRDNGSVVSKVLKLSGTELIVEKPLGFDSKIWVELSNDEQELRGEKGSLVKLNKVEGNRFILESAISKPDGISEEWPTKARRWDQDYNSNSIEDAIPIVEGGWIEIENGIEINFLSAQIAPDTDTHQYRTGDFWLIPARVVSRDIEWPIKTGDNGDKDPIPREPFGIQHHYAPLAILDMKTQQSILDYRCKFEPLKCAKK